MRQTDLLDTVDFPFVAPLYIDVANLLTTIETKNLSFKNAFYNAGLQWNSSMKAVYALALNVLNQMRICDKLAEDVAFENEDPPPKNLIRVLITDLLWGKKHLRGSNVIVKTITNQRAHFKNVLLEMEGNNNEVVGSTPNIRFCRVNTLKTNMEEIISYLTDRSMVLVETPISYEEYLTRARALKEFEFMVDFHFDNYLVFSEKTSSTIIQDDYFQTGALVLQDKSSQAAVKLLAPGKNSVVADLCAAPGMKTSSIADIMENTGTIYACDRLDDRLKNMYQLLNKSGVNNVISVLGDSSKVPVKFDSNTVDYILLDAPCSGSGMVRRAGYMDVTDDSSRLQKLHNLQCQLLKCALKNYQNAKRLIYSTCSVHKEENEAVIEEMLKLAHYKGWELKDAHELIQGLSKGNTKFTCGEKCLYFLPDKDICNGFFLAVFERTSEPKEPMLNKKDGKRKNKSFKENPDNHDVKSNNADISNQNLEHKKTKRKRRRKNTTQEGMDNKEDNESTELNNSLETNLKKKHKPSKFGKKDVQDKFEKPKVNENASGDIQSINGSGKSKRRKRKRKITEKDNVVIGKKKKNEDMEIKPDLIHKNTELAGSKKDVQATDVKTVSKKKRTRRGRSRKKAVEENQVASAQESSVNPAGKENGDCITDQSLQLKKKKGGEVIEECSNKNTEITDSPKKSKKIHKSKYKDCNAEDVKGKGDAFQKSGSCENISEGIQPTTNNVESKKKGKRKSSEMVEENKVFPETDVGSSNATNTLIFPKKRKKKPKNIS